MAMTYDAMGNPTGIDDPSLDTTPEQDQQKKLRHAADAMIKLGIAPSGGFDQKDKPGTLDTGKVDAAIKDVRHEMVEQKALSTSASMDDFLTVLDKTVAAYEQKNAPAAAAATTVPEAKKPAQAGTSSHAKPAEPKVRTPEELKNEEANAYLRVLGKKDLAEFRADNILNGGADLKGKDLTSPEVMAALKARVTGTPEAQAYARQMLSKDATTDRKSSQNLNGQDVVALQYMLKANGQDIGTFGQSKNGIDGVQGDYTRKAAETVASPSFIKGGQDVKASTQTPVQTKPANPATPTQVSGQNPAPVQAPVPAPGLPVDGGAGSSAQGQQQPMTAQPPAGAQLVPYPQPGYSAVPIGTRNGMSPHFTGQAAGGIIVTDPQTRISYNPYTGQYMNPSTGHVINPNDRNGDGAISANEYRAAVNRDNLESRGTYMTGNMRGAIPILSQWTNAFPTVQQNAWGARMHNESRYDNGLLGQAAGLLMDRNRNNDGVGIARGVQGILNKINF